MTTTNANIKGIGFLLLAIWREIPTVMTLAGAALTLLSGLYIFYWERKVG